MLFTLSLHHCKLKERLREKFFYYILKNPGFPGAR